MSIAKQTTIRNVRSRASANTPDRYIQEAIDSADQHHHTQAPPDQFTLSGADDDSNASPVTCHCPHYPAGHVIPNHHHHRAQLLYALSGVMMVTTEAGRWTVPPQQAVWIPAATSHDVQMPGPVSMRSLYIRPDIASSLASECKVVEVTPLLRELIATLVTGQRADLQQLERLMAVLVDEVKLLHSPPLHLPTPHDHRLCRITEVLINNPSDERDLETWSQSVGASTRTLARLFKKETGLGFREWRQQLRLLKAIELLAMGEDVTSVSLTLGYQSPSAFISMFRRVLGTTPGRYFTNN